MVTATRTGQTEHAGDITLTLVSGTSSAGTFTITYGGMPITYPDLTAPPAGIVKGSVGFAGSVSISTSSSNSAGQLSINVPAGVSGGTITVSGIRVAVADSGLQSLTANISGVGNAIVGGQTSVTVINSLANGISVQGNGASVETATGVVSGSAYVIVTEGYPSAFGVPNEPSSYGAGGLGKGALMLRITLSAAPPTGVRLAMPRTSSLFVATDSSGTPLAAGPSFTNSSVPPFTAYYKLSGNSNPAKIEILAIPVAITTSETIGGGSPIKCSVTLAPVGTSTYSPTAYIPRYEAEESNPFTLVTFVTPTADVTVTAIPEGRAISINGKEYATPHKFSCESGTSLSIGTITPQVYGLTRYVFADWSDGGAISHTITCTGTPTTYSANFTTQYYLTMNAGTGGTVTPLSGWYNRASGGEVMQIQATETSGYAFTGWTGTGSGSYTGPDKSATITMDGPITETASFTRAAPMSLSQSSLDYSYLYGSTTVPAPQSVFLSSGESAISFSTSSSASWLRVSASSAVTPANLTISVDPVSPQILTPNTYRETVTISSQGATNSPLTIAVSLTVTPPPLPSFTYDLPSTMNPAEQKPLQVSLASEYPLPVKGILTLFFNPNVVDSTGGEYDEYFIVGSSRSTEAVFSFDAGERQAKFNPPDAVLNSGTVAGVIRIVASLQLSDGGSDVTPEPMPAQDITVPKVIPVITDTCSWSQTSSGFDVVVTGYSTPREIRQATFRFDAAPGALLNTQSLTQDVQSAFATFYRDPTSGLGGSSFTYTQPFNVQGNLGDIASVTVTLSNEMGTSQSKTCQRR